MVSSYTTNKNLEKPGNGDYVDTWNVPVNSDMDVIDSAFGGVTSLNATGGSAVLTDTQYQKMALNITGAISAAVVYTIPSGVGGSWIVRNATTDASGGPWSVTIASGGGGSSVVCTRNKAINIYSDGTNIRDVSENVTDLGTVTSVNVSGGTTGLTTSGGPVTTSGTITIAGTLATTNGGTGLTTFTAANNAIYSTSASAVTAGTLPVLAGGTGVTTSTGTGSVVLSNSPALTTPNLGTPSAITLTNATGLPLTTGVTGTLPVANGGTGVTTSTGSGSNVLSNSPALTTPNLGTPSAITLTNATGLPLSSGITGTLPVGNGGTGLTSPGSNGNFLVSNGSGFVSSAFGSNSLASSGYQTLPGGLYIQWGVTGNLNGSPSATSFPVAFPNNCFTVVATFFTGSGNNEKTIYITSKSTTSFSAIGIGVSGAAADRPALFIAIGN